MRKRQSCVECGERWVQANGLCRSCARAIGVDTRSSRQRDADALTLRLQHGPKGGTRPPAEHLTPRPPRLLEIDGQYFEVTWDGA